MGVSSSTSIKQNSNRIIKTAQACTDIDGLATTDDGNYATTGDVSLDVNWNIPAGKTLFVRENHTFNIFKKLTVNGKIIVEKLGTLNNVSKNSLNITGTGAVIVEENGILNNGVDQPGTILNRGSLVVYGTLNNNAGSKLDNTSGEVSYSGKIDNDGTITNQGIFYKSVFRNPIFIGKPDDLKLTNGLFGKFAFTYINSTTISVPKNTKLTILSNGLINNKSTINNDGIIELQVNSTSGIVNDGNINNNGEIINTVNTIDNKNDGTITNNGTITNIGTINNDGTIDNKNDCTITNTGTITNFDGAITNNGTINNGITVFDKDLDGTITNRNGTIQNNNTINNNKLSTINNNNGTINNNKLSTINNNNGTINNFKTIQNNGIIKNNGKICEFEGSEITGDGKITKTPPVPCEEP